MNQIQYVFVSDKLKQWLEKSLERNAGQLDVNSKEYIEHVISGEQSLSYNHYNAIVSCVGRPFESDSLFRDVDAELAALESRLC